MSAIQIIRQIFIDSLNRLRVQHFGADSMKVFGITPETGETQLAELLTNWSGRRVESATDSEKDAGFWQFQIVAADDWQTSQVYLMRAVSLQIGERRFVVKKLEKPIGNAKVWKIRAQIQ